MKKIYSLLLLGGLLLFGAQSAFADDPSWMGNAAISVNNYWRYADTSMGWCSTAFNGANLGTISHLNLGGQIQAYDRSVNWGSGYVTMGYEIKTGSPASVVKSGSIDLTYWKFESNNMFFQSDGATLKEKSIDISTLANGNYELHIWYQCGASYLSNGGANYVANFTISKATITLSSACTYDGKFYGTYSNDMAFEVPSDLTVAAVSVAGGQLTVTPYETGDIVKAGIGVMVSASTAGEKTVYLTGAEGSEIGGNMLKGTGNSGISASSMAKSGYKFYRLTMHNGTQIGFYWGAANGAEFDLAANKAYLEVPDGQTAAPARFWMEEDATNIESIEAAEEGVKFIENGKLFIKKNGVVYDMLGTIVR